jgi:hypothetical protein
LSSISCSMSHFLLLLNAGVRAETVCDEVGVVGAAGTERDGGTNVDETEVGTETDTGSACGSSVQIRSASMLPSSPTSTRIIIPSFQCHRPRLR